MIDSLDFIRKASGFYVPPLIGFAANPLGRFQPCADCCGAPSSPCSLCTTGTAAYNYSVVVAGVTGSAACLTSNGTFVVTKTLHFGCLGGPYCIGCTGGTCGWIGGGGDFPFVSLIVCKTATNWEIRVPVRPTFTGGVYVLFKKSYGAAVDCLGLSNESIPPVAGFCGWGGATCLVSVA